MSCNTRKFNVIWLALVFVLLLPAACVETMGPDSEVQEGSLNGGNGGGENGDNGDGGERVTICHIPPGNPDNAHTITISINAWPAHRDNHGDTMGPCPGDGSGEEPPHDEEPCPPEEPGER